MNFLHQIFNKLIEKISWINEVVPEVRLNFVISFEQNLVPYRRKSATFAFQNLTMQKEATLKEKWHYLVEELTKQFSDGEDLNLDGIIYLIGVQELGQGKRRFKKDEKVNLMHIAICRLLEPYGYYEFDYFDNDGWPHYKMLTELPNLKPGEQTVLMKQAIISYFDGIDFFK